MPGYDTLQELRADTTNDEVELGAVEPYILNTSHLKFLENDTYHRYLKMHKVALGASGYRELEHIGESLEGQYMPRFVDAGAWSFAEIGLFDQTRTRSERFEFVERAESLWQTALNREMQLNRSVQYGSLIDEHDTPHRLAVTLAFAPLMKDLVKGDVTSSVRMDVLRDVVSIAHMTASDMTAAREGGSISEANGYLGLMHEINAYSALLYNDDPRYIPMPATARGDSGYYHREQTHDMSVINQHWGTVKKVLPIEIKASASLRDRKRYRALIIRGKMHLTPDGVDPRKTNDAFNRYVDGTANLKDTLIVERLSHDVRDMLRLYQRGGTYERVALGGLTRFYTTRDVAKTYPGLAV